MPDTADSAAGLVGGRYEIVRPLASGGMATVYVARHHLTRQEVALKIIASVFARDEAGVARFLREVSVASRIQHDGVVKVFDAGFDAALGSPYLAMELLDGRSLADMLGERRVDMEGAMRLVLAFLDPLAAAHDAGVVHRDLKPENVFVTHDGRVKLLDFGVARDLRGSRTATLEGTALGTVYYMAPEQAIDARSAGAAADIYAVGVTLYQIVCGIFPFDGTTPHAVLIRANRETAVPTATRAPWVHPNLAELIDRCLAKDPNERPEHASTLRGLLAALLDDAEVCATLKKRAVNPATFLSSPPPPSLSGDFDDPFGAKTPDPPVASPPASTPEAAAANNPPPPTVELTPVVAPRPSRRPVWLVAVLVLPLLVAALAFVLRAPSRAPVAPPTTARAASPLPPAPGPSPVRPPSIPAVLPQVAAAQPSAATTAPPAPDRPRRSDALRDPRARANVPTAPTRTVADPTVAAAEPSAPTVAVVAAQPPPAPSPAAVIAPPTPPPQPPVEPVRAAPPVAAPRPAPPPAPTEAPPFVTF